MNSPHEYPYPPLPPTPGPGPVQPRGRSPLLIVLGVLAVLLVAVAVAIAVKLVDDESAAATPPPVATTEPTVLRTVTATATGQPPAATTPGVAAPQSVGGENSVWSQRFGNAVATLYLSDSGHNWVTVSSSGGLPGDARIWSPHSGWQASRSYSNAPSTFSSPAVYAPGDTCIRIIVTFGVGA